MIRRGRKRRDMAKCYQDEIDRCMRRCYQDEVDYDPDDLGGDEWLTGCPRCGMSGSLCGRTEEDALAIDAELDSQY